MARSTRRKNQQKSTSFVKNNSTNSSNLSTPDTQISSDPKRINANIPADQHSATSQPVWNVWFSKLKKFSILIYSGLAFMIGFYINYDYFTPIVDVESTRSLNPVDPFSSLLTITNGSNFSIKNVNISFLADEYEDTLQNRFENVYTLRSEIVPIIRAGRKIELPIPSDIRGEGLKYIKGSIILNYKIDYIITSRMNVDTFSFLALPDINKQVIWSPRSK